MGDDGIRLAGRTPPTSVLSPHYRTAAEVRLYAASRQPGIAER
jgi:hypothetical protein